MSQIILPLIPSKIFIVSGLTFKLSLHLEFIFLYGVMQCSNFIVLHETVLFSLHQLIEETVFFSILYSSLFSQI